MVPLQRTKLPGNQWHMQLNQCQKTERQHTKLRRKHWQSLGLVRFLWLYSRSRTTTGHSFSHSVWSMLLILSGDIESNPGPGEYSVEHKFNTCSFIKSHQSTYMYKELLLYMYIQYWWCILFSSKLWCNHCYTSVPRRCTSVQCDS